MQVEILKHIINIGRVIDRGTKPRSPSLYTDSLPTVLSGKPRVIEQLRNLNESRSFKK